MLLRLAVTPGDVPISGLCIFARAGKSTSSEYLSWTDSLLSHLHERGHNYALFLKRMAGGDIALGMKENHDAY